MSLQVKVVHHEDDSVTIYCEVSKVNLATGEWTASDADAGYPKLSITDSLGAVQVSEQTMTKISATTGKYFHTYQPSSPSKGVWDAKVKCQVTVEGSPHVETTHTTFEEV